MIRHIQPTTIPETNAPFSQVVLDDNYAFISGLVAADLSGSEAELGDITVETKAVLKAIDRILEEIGLDMGQIVRVDVHLVSLDDFAAMDAAYGEFFEEGKCPARTTTESHRLFGGSLVEITCMVRRR
jgi:2-iminobutanoate/2-iminopropanoate deaminase